MVCDIQRENLGKLRSYSNFAVPFFVSINCVLSDAHCSTFSSAHGPSDALHLRHSEPVMAAS